MTENERSYCSTFHRAIELVGRRWAGAILQVLRNGPARFGEVREQVPDLTARMLAARLQELEQVGIVLRSVIPERPPRAEYSLTEMGGELVEALDALGNWAHRWMPLEAEAGAESGDGRTEASGS
jgi:DNA-binding HxlR family transcriptional regulator